MQLTLPAGDFRAYLFDCDGTIADSMPLHYIAWKQATSGADRDLSLQDPGAGQGCPTGDPSMRLAPVRGHSQDAVSEGR